MSDINPAHWKCKAPFMSLSALMHGASDNVMPLELQPMVCWPKPWSHVIFMFSRSTENVSPILI